MRQVWGPGLFGRVEHTSRRLVATARRTAFFCISCSEWNISRSRWMLHRLRSFPGLGDALAVRVMVDIALCQIVTYWANTVESVAWRVSRIWARIERDLLEADKGQGVVAEAVGERERSVRRSDTRGSGRGQEIRWWEKEDRAAENSGQAATELTASELASLRR